MKRLSIVIILLGILFSGTFLSGKENTAPSITLDFNLISKENLFEHVLTNFIDKNGGINNPKFSQFYNKSNFVLPAPASSFFQVKGLKLSIDLTNQKLLFKCNTTIDGFEKIQITDEYPLPARNIINTIVTQQKAYPSQLDKFPEYRELVLNNVKLPQLKEFIKEGFADLQKDNLICKFNLVESLPQLKPKYKGCDPHDITVFYEIINKRDGDEVNNYKEAFQDILKEKLRETGFLVVAKNLKPQYLIKINLYPGADQDISSAYKTTLVSMRVNSILTVLLKDKPIYTTSESAAEVALIKESASMKATLKIAQKISELTVAAIAGDQFSY